MRQNKIESDKQDNTKSCKAYLLDGGRRREKHQTHFVLTPV